MDNVRASLFKTKNKLKQRLMGRDRKPDGTGASGEERADSTGSLPQPEPSVIADKSHGREGDRADTLGERVVLTGQPPQPDGPKSVPARGSDNGQEEGDADIGGGEASQRDSHPHPDVEVAVGSCRSGELEGVHPPPSAPSISHGVEPYST